MTPFVHYKRLENEAADSITMKLRSFGNEVSRFARRSIILGKQRITIMLVPHSEKKIINFHISVFSLIFGFALFAAVVAVLFVARADAEAATGLLSSSTRSLQSSQANLHQVESRITNLVQVSHVFETAMTKTMGTLGFHNVSYTGPTPGDPVSSISEIAPGESPTAARDMAELRNLSQVMSSSVQSIKRVVAFYESHKRLLTELPTMWPVRGGRGVITTFFGPAIHPFTHRMYLHTGVDIAYSEGTPIIAAADGVVVTTAYQPLGYGNYVFIRHNFGFYTRYAHLMRIFVHEGQRVKQGQEIGVLGTTGLSTGPHLHFEIWLGSQVVDPLRFLDISGHHAVSTLVSQD